jgi:hypothetical protein
MNRTKIDWDNLHPNTILGQLVQFVHEYTTVPAICISNKELFDLAYDSLGKPYCHQQHKELGYNIIKNPDSFTEDRVKHDTRTMIPILKKISSDLKKNITI